MATYAPRHCDIWPWTAWFSAVGAVTRTQVSTYFGLGRVDTSGAQNDEIVYNVALDAGTWTFTVHYEKWSAAGIATFYLDSTSLGTVDCYGSAVNNTTQITGITVATPAVYAFKAKMTSKNASASVYTGYFYGFTFTRTGA